MVESPVSITPCGHLSDAQSSTRQLAFHPLIEPRQTYFVPLSLVFMCVSACGVWVRGSAPAL